MATKGCCSRKEAIEFIKKGLVLLDNKVVEKDSLVDPRYSNVALSRRGISIQENKLSILLHKPVGYLSVPADNRAGNKYSFDLLTAQNRYYQHNFPVRYKNLVPSKLKNLKSVSHLQVSTSGLSLFSQDGRLSNLKLIHEYISTLEGEVGEENLSILRTRQYIDGVPVPPFDVKLIDSNRLSFTLIDILPGQILKLCQFAGLSVKRITRVRLGNIYLGNLPPGKWRLLERFEL